MLQRRDFRAVHSDVSQVSAANPLPASGAFVDVADPWEQGSVSGADEFCCGDDASDCRSGEWFRPSGE